MDRLYGEPADRPGITTLPERVVFFDGDCLLCQRSVRFIARFDRRGTFRFAPLGGATAVALMGGRPDHPELQGTVVLFDRGRLHTRSTALLRIAERLDWPARGLAGLGLVPRPVRDWAYGVVARHRVRWFGRRALCDLPSRVVRSRLLP